MEQQLHKVYPVLGKPTLSAPMPSHAHTYSQGVMGQTWVTLETKIATISPVPCTSPPKKNTLCVYEEAVWSGHFCPFVS